MVYVQTNTTLRHSGLWLFLLALCEEIRGSES